MKRCWISIAALPFALLLGCTSQPPAPVQAVLDVVPIWAPASEFTATREDIKKANFTRSIIKISAIVPRRSEAGYIFAGETISGVALYRDMSGGEFFLQDGVLVASTGFLHELLGADSAPVIQALEAASITAEPQTYDKILRHRNPEGYIIVSQMACVLEREMPETLLILGREEPSFRYGEVCVAPPDAAGRSWQINNAYWRSPSGRPVASLQWLNHEFQYLRIEHIQ